MFKKTTVWAGLAALGGLSLVFIAQNFTAAWPVVNLRVTMSRAQALEQAAALAGARGWGPADYRTAAVFDSDRRVQNFVELEAGGKPAFAALIKNGLYSPYYWQVRHFREGEINETMIWLTPGGAPCGFREKIAEDAPGPALAEPAARQIAEAAMRDDWGIPLEEFQAVETSKEVRANRRVDHAFIYERIRERLGDGRYRVRAEVGGDKLTALQHYIKVPEAFDRRYEQMRSANHTLAMASVVIIGVFYFGAGCLAGLFYLLRRRWLIWRPAVLAGAGIALLGALSMLNYLAQAWMQYDTALPASRFLNEFFLQAAGQFLFMLLPLSLTFMVAEGFTRRAWPHQVQFWQIWRPRVAGTPEIAGQVAGGYVLAALLVAYDIGVYLACNRLFGWWSPSDTLLDPNIVSMYLPWLSPFAMSLQAGCWEECLFRAVPLAGAALLGRRWGRPRTAVALALVLQALVFGAAHANYPQQPAYVRIVEIAPAFLVFGLLYLRFGLVPVIVAHYAVDMSLMSIPLFFTSIPGIWLSRAVAAILLAAPGLAVAAVALRQRWRPAPREAFNAAWTPPPPAAAVPAAAPEQPGSGLTVRQFLSALALGAVGTVLWLGASDFTAHFERLRMDCHTARRQAQDVLQAAGMMPAGAWQILTSVDDAPGFGERYVWREFGPGRYRELQTNGYLGQAAWRVKWQRFDQAVDVAERAEAFGVALAATGRVVRIYHRLPEARPGAAMAEDEARRLAREFLAETLPWPAGVMREIASEPAQRPHRTDWAFTFADSRFAYLTNDEARVSVGLADGRIVGYNRSIRVPEPWQRAETGRASQMKIVSMICTVAIIIIFQAGLLAAILRWSRRQLARPLAVRVYLIGLAAAVLGFANRWPAIVAGFSTGEPFANQVLQTLAQAALAWILAPGIAALCIGMAAARPGAAPAGGPREWLAALAWGVFFQGATVAAAWFFPVVIPYWPQDGWMANTFAPWLSGAMGGLVDIFLLRTAFMLTVLLAVNGLMRRGGSAAWGARLLLVGLGFLLIGRSEVFSIPAWLVQGLLAGIMLAAIHERLLRGRLYLLPMTLAGWMAPELIRRAVIHSHPAVLPAYLLAVIVLLGFGWLLGRWLREPKHI